MEEIMLFHHAQGLTPGVVAFADRLRRAGHIVHTPDLFDGQTFDDLEKGMRFVRELGFGEVMERGERAVAGLPAELVYADSLWAWFRHRSWPKPGPERAGHFSSIPVCRSRSSGQPGQKRCRCKCMAWMLILFLLGKATSTLLGPSSLKPRRGNFSSILAISTTLPIARCLRTMRKPPSS